MTAPTEDLIERLKSHLGSDDIADILPDCLEAAQALRALQQEAARLREACVAIQNLEHTEDNEWDAVETVIPAMVAVATKALTRTSTSSDFAPLQSI